MTVHINYVAREKKKAILVVVMFGEFPVPFIFKDGKIMEIVMHKRTRISTEDFQKILRQIYAILKNSETKNESSNFLSLNYREKKEEIRRLKNLEKFKTRPASNGKVEIIRAEIKNGERVEKSNVYKDIYAAIRSQNHILDNYFGKKNCELDAIREIEFTIAFASNVLLNWRSTGKPAVKDINVEIKKSADMLRLSRNTSKRLAFKQLEKIPGLRDVLGRINPSAMAARIATAGENIGKRTREIEFLISYAICLQTALLQEEREIKRNILSAKCILKAILNSHQKIWHNQEFIFEKLKQVTILLQSAWTNPFKIPADNAMCLISKAFWHLSQNELLLFEINIRGALAYLS